VLAMLFPLAGETENRTANTASNHYGGRGSGREGAGKVRRPHWR